MTRDHRLIAAGALFIGAFVGRAILGKLGTAGALGVAVGFRVLMVLQWVFVPDVKEVRRVKKSAPPAPTDLGSDEDPETQFRFLLTTTIIAASTQRRITDHSPYPLEINTVQ